VREIKQKQDIQARFQLALGQSTTQVSSWLNPSASSHQETVDDDPSKSDFFALPIIADGSGLSLSDEINNDADINTIGDYVKSGKSLRSLRNKKKNTPNGHHIQRTDSRALNALKNKMRTSIRSRANEKVNQSISQQLLSKKTVKRIANDSDSDDDIPVPKTTKKTFKSILDSKPAKRKK
jgi:hypothetical protein